MDARHVTIEFALHGTMRVLLTGARAPATLELARLCARAGHEVHVADTSGWHVCRGSRLVARHHRLPAPRDSLAAYAEALRHCAAQYRIDVVVPTCEEVFHLSAIRERVGVRVVCEPRERLRVLHDKWQFIAATRAAGLDAPRTWLLDDSSADETERDTERILKPRYSRFATRVLRVPRGSARPPLALLHARAPGGWIAQEYLDGAARCTWSVAAAGRVLAHVTYAVDATAGPLGAAIAFHSVRHHAIREWVQHFSAHHRLSGQFAFDFIETSEGVRAIECNPRLTSGIHCFRALPTVANLLVGTVSDTAGAILEPEPGLRFRSRLALAVYRQPHHDGAGLLDAPDDPWPRRLQLVSWAQLLTAAAVSRTDPRVLSTRDIEWNGE